MSVFSLEVSTGSMHHAGMFGNLHVTLIGTERRSERTELSSFGLDFKIGQTGNFTVTTLFSLGCLLLLKLERDPYHELPETEWFCSTIVVTVPKEDVLLFPCHRWVSRGERVVLRGGRATKPFEDDHPTLLDHRTKELAFQKDVYQWDEFKGGLPYTIGIRNPTALPTELRYSFSKSFEFAFTNKEAEAELRLKGLLDAEEQWESFEAIKEVFWFEKTPILDYVSEHWKDDEFFGYQFLNGGNPYVIRRCSKLPSNFAVAEEMVKPFLANGSTLKAEMEKGNIFICDYKNMEGLSTKVIGGKPLNVTAALCLLYLNPEKKLLPIAIQLGQQPSENNPVFLPSDTESDWLLAQLFVKNVHAIDHEIVQHLLLAHLTPEVYTVATLRNLPLIHPLHKLLIPHHRSTLQVNLLVRPAIQGNGKILNVLSLDEPGLDELQRRTLSEVTYSSLCLPENIAARGLESIPNYYFRDDAMRLWSIINSFVTAVVAYYYPSNYEVVMDFELQQWIHEIFTFGFLGNRDTGMPERFQTVEEVIKFVTLVIYTASAHHTSLNYGQIDYLGWIPNGSLLLSQPPPVTKGQSSMETILKTLPNKSVTSKQVLILWLLSKKYDDFVPLGSYPDRHFEEPAVQQMIEDFQAELSSLSAMITKRNLELELPYNYLNPTEIENSVTI
ncbi:polyunsaturated fatty acid lipoxygenase ALOX15B-like [Genypterus blacodes]|uniref:polyunsaturated fatty acid lipoxygenase ALOX15B-like n=1 Tax=Genypterus blacodes TaxID=154954 RepID=UPI003F75C20E